jgi:hypothetical protein
MVGVLSTSPEPNVIFPFEFQKKLVSGLQTGGGPALPPNRNSNPPAASSPVLGG